MPLFIGSLSCSFDPKEGVVIVEDKTVRFADGGYYLTHLLMNEAGECRDIRLFIKESRIDFKELSGYSGIDIDQKQQLLQYFIDHFYHPELLLKVKAIEPVDEHRLRITFCARGDVLSYQVLDSTLVLTKLIEPHKLDIIGYVMCLVDKCKTTAIIKLCEHYCHLMKQNPRDEEEKKGWQDVMTDIMEVINKKLNLTVEELIESDPKFRETIMLYSAYCNLAEDHIDVFKTFSDLTFREVLHNLRQPVVQMFRELKGDKEYFGRDRDNYLLQLLSKKDKQIDDAIKKNAKQLTKYVEEHKLNRVGQTLLTEDEYNA